MNTMSFNMIPLHGVNKKGIVKPDEHGYRLVVLGGFQVYNSVGDFYPFDDHVRRLFDTSSTFMRMIQKGALRGEMEHPSPGPHDSATDFLNRILRIDKDRESHIIRNVFLDTEKVKDENGRPIVAVLGLVKPSGVFGHLLEESFNDPYQNVAFSIRSLSENKPLMGGRLQRHVKQIVTWDWVTEGGISIADKYWSPALEAFRKNKELIVTKDMIASLTDKTPDGVSNENLRLNIEELKASFGWEYNPATVLNW